VDRPAARSGLLKLRKTENRNKGRPVQEPAPCYGSKGIRPLTLLSDVPRVSTPRVAAFLLGLLLALPPDPASAQALDDVMRGIREGGGWVSIPIEAGSGTFRSIPLPTFGLAVKGCMQVWGGHSGGWQISARDLLGEATLEVDVGPGEDIPFTYASGMRAQIEVNFKWSEARDTTLLLWVGLEGTEEEPRDPCRPSYEGR
jgi:hypothetical protein